jgi:hypothetical protein
MRSVVVACLTFIFATLLAVPSVGAQGKDDIPPAFRPPAGMCRIWIEGVPAGRQPAPTDCSTAIRRRPPNARVIFGDQPTVPPVRGYQPPTRGYNEQPRDTDRTPRRTEPTDRKDEARRAEPKKEPPPPRPPSRSQSRRRDPPEAQPSREPARFRRNAPEG